MDDQETQNVLENELKPLRGKQYLGLIFGIVGIMKLKEEDYLCIIKNI